MALSKALAQTYKVSYARAVADADYLRPVQARLAAEPFFASQVALVGGISESFRLLQPIIVNFEEAGDGKLIASDEIFYMYGEGNTRRDALIDYVSSLSEYYELLSSHEDAPSVELFQFLQSYLQPVRR